MVDGIQLKVCGLTSLADAQMADRSGADYLGFIFHPKSPRFISMEQFKAIAPQLPKRSKVAVSVEPTMAELAAVQEAGFDYFQIHFRHNLPVSTIEAWSKLVGTERLFFAPKLPPEIDVPTVLLPLANFFLLDTFHAVDFGGSGKVGDWNKFA